MSRLLCFAALVALAGLALAAPAASAAPGDLDPTFAGGAGTERFFPSEEKIGLRAVAVQADGKIILGGFEQPGNLVLARLLVGGGLDPSFGNGGKVSLPFAPGFGEARAIAIQPDGKIVAAGGAKGVGTVDFLVVRYLANGAPDPSFGGGDGIETIPVGAAYDEAEAVSIGAGGRIFLTGRTELPGPTTGAGVAVLQADGKPDPGFSTDGVAILETTGSEKSDEGVAIVEQPGGAILVADSTGNGAGHGATVVRLLGSGTPDPGFGGGDGIVVAPFPSATNPGAKGRVTDLALLPDGRIAISGYGFEEKGGPVTFDSQFAAARLLGDGQLETGFGGAGSGFFTDQLGAVGGEDAARTIAVTPSGKVLLAGSYEADVAGSNDSPAVLRLDSDGHLDPSFGNGGAVLRGVTAPFGEFFKDAALDGEERLVVLSTAFEGGGQTKAVVTRILGDKQPRLVNKRPRARIKKVPKKVAAAKLKWFRGTAADPDGDGLRKVQIAVEKLKKGKGKKGAVRPRHWRAVKGKAKWSFRLKHPLAPGRYVVFARAVDGTGLAENEFSRRAGNRFALRVLP